MGDVLEGLIVEIDTETEKINAIENTTVKILQNNDLSDDLIRIVQSFIPERKMFISIEECTLSPEIIKRIDFQHIELLELKNVKLSIYAGIALSRTMNVSEVVLHNVAAATFAFDFMTLDKKFECFTVSECRFLVGNIFTEKLIIMDSEIELHRIEDMTKKLSIENCNTTRVSNQFCINEVEELEILNTKIFDFSLLFKNMDENRWLKKLHLRNTEILSDLDFFFEKVNDYTALTEIDLSCNMIGDFDVFFEKLKSNTTIETLNIDHNICDINGLPSMLSHNKPLKYVSALGNFYSQEVFAEIELKNKDRTIVFK